MGAGVFTLGHNGQVVDAQDFKNDVREARPRLSFGTAVTSNCTVQLYLHWTIGSLIRLDNAVLDSTV